MSKKKPKFLVETSAIPPALKATTPRYTAYFNEAIADGALYSSLYIRKEFMRRWICDTIRVALVLKQCTTWADALVILEQDFGRKPKGTLDVVQHLLRQTGTINNSEAAAEEVGRLAWQWLKLFDRVFAAKVNNLSKCQIGGRELKVDGNSLLSDLYAFYVEFQKPITDCEVNDFLSLAEAKSKARGLLDHFEAKKCDSVENLDKLSANGTNITCKECGTIGDAIVALEQPNSWCLVHVDKAFNALCGALEKENKHIKSLTAVAKIDLNPDSTGSQVASGSE